MDKKDFIQEVDEREIELMLGYVPAYSQEHAKNIKHQFEQKAKKVRRKAMIKKMALVGTAASFVLVTSLVYAGVVDMSKLYQMIFGGNDGYIEQYIEPFEEIRDEIPEDDAGAAFEAVPEETGADLSIQSAYDGIVMKLISAIKDENQLLIFAEVTDTTGDRLGESLDSPSWGLSQGYGGNISVIDYNAQTKSAVVMITSLGSDHEGEATLTMNGFTTGREMIENLPEDTIHISELIKDHTPEIIEQSAVWKRGGSGHSEGPDVYLSSRFLQVDELDMPFENNEMFTLSNVGFVDGVLHIQAKAAVSGVALTDGYFIYLKFVDDKQEIVYQPSATIQFVVEQKYGYGMQDEPHDEYIDLIYEGITSIEQIEGLSIVMDYMKSPDIIEGQWQFSFVVPKKVTTEFQVGREIPINGELLPIDKIALSPLGVTVHLHQDLSKAYNHRDEVFIERTDGTVFELDESALHTLEGASTIIFSGEIIEIENVQSFVINGEKIDISQ